MTDSINNGFDAARKQRQEEQIVAAILHMSSPWGILALISSGVVWATCKSRSRFLMVQALQAFLFQLFSFLAFAAMFVIFMVGFYYSAFSGLIARTGVSEPELTSNLIAAGAIGFAAIMFFEFIFPLWGIWAGIQILRGKSFQYPILGNAVVRYTSRQPFIVKAESLSRYSSASENDNILAGLGHLIIFTGFGLVLAPILWATAKTRSQFLSHHLFQASLFQILITLLFACLYFAVWGGSMLLGVLQIWGIASPNFMNTIFDFWGTPYASIGFMIMFVLLGLLSGVSIIMATVQAFRGKEFYYPLIGKWLWRYIQ